MNQIPRTALKCIKDSRSTGFASLNTRLNNSPIWQKLERVGLSSTEDYEQFAPREPGQRVAEPVVFKYEKFTGKVLLKIRGSGIRERIFINKTCTKDRTIPDVHRQVFKNDVYKSLKSLYPTCGEYFSLWLHYNCGAMNKLELEDTTNS
jgi:hypothetical protein